MSTSVSAKYAEILKLLGRAEAPEPSMDEVAASEIHDAIDSYFACRETVQSVLGVDIYGYSRFGPEQQRLVPAAFKWVFETSVELAVTNDPFLFPDPEFSKRFVPTGDGGFLILKTPLHGIAFAAYLQAVVEGFNSGFFHPQFRREILNCGRGSTQRPRSLTLRYALTRDNVFQMDENWFGAGIISNARVMSRDTLNRFLIDADTVNWFGERVGTIESLMAIKRAALPELVSETKSQAPSVTSTFKPPDSFVAALWSKRP